MSSLILITLGAFMLGWLIPEFLGAIVKHRQHYLLNVWAGVGVAMLALGIALQ